MKPDMSIPVGLILILIMAGCVEPKEPLTFPTDIQLHIGLTTQNLQTIYWSGQIGIQTIRFEGKREKGEDVFFETDPAENFQPFELQYPQRHICDFEIPRGVYTYMKWEIVLKKIMTQEITSYVDLDSLEIGLIISGIDEYWMFYPEGLPNPVVFAADDTVTLSFLSNAEVNFDLSGNRRYEIILSLDPCTVYYSIDRDSLQYLEITKVRFFNTMSDVVLITCNKNENLYNQIIKRMARTIRVD